MSKENIWRTIGCLLMVKEYKVEVSRLNVGFQDDASHFTVRASNYDNKVVL